MSKHTSKKQLLLDEALRTELDRQAELEQLATEGARVICSIDNNDEGCYNDVTPNEYLNLSARHNPPSGLKGIADMLAEISSDTSLKQIDFSYNIPLEEVTRTYYNVTRTCHNLTRKCTPGPRTWGYSVVLGWSRSCSHSEQNFDCVGSCWKSHRKVFSSSHL